MKDLTEETTDRELLARLWTVCEQLLHTDQYKSAYTDWLSQLLKRSGPKSQSILDTAAGVGFPSVQLASDGYESIWFADADPDLLRSLQASLNRQQRTYPIICAMWQNLPDIVMNQFDTVLCLDASIAFMDSWGTSQMVEGPDTILRRVTDVLENFFKLTAPGGSFYVGLQKNNNRNNMSQYVMEVGTAMIGDAEATATWDMRYDWDRRRKTWNNIVRFQGEDYRQTRHSYLFDKEELASMLVDAGFTSAQEVATEDFFYEDVIVAKKGS